MSPTDRYEATINGRTYHGEVARALCELTEVNAGLTAELSAALAAKEAAEGETRRLNEDYHKVATYAQAHDAVVARAERAEADLTRLRADWATLWQIAFGEHQPPEATADGREQIRERLASCADEATRARAERAEDRVAELEARGVCDACGCNHELMRGGRWPDMVRGYERLEAQVRAVEAACARAENDPDESEWVLIDDLRAALAAVAPSEPQETTP